MNGDYGIKADDVELQDSIPKGDVPKSAPLESTEVDVNVKGEVTIDGETFNSPAIESKHYNPNNRPLDDMVASDIKELTRKLTTQAATGEDEIVVVTTDEYLSSYKHRLEDIPDDVKAHPEVDQDVRIKFTTYEDLRNNPQTSLAATEFASGMSRPPSIHSELTG